MRRSLWLGILILAAATPAAAGVGKGNGELGFDLGYTSFDSDTTGQSGVRLAVRGGYHFTSRFELEGLYGTSIHYVSAGVRFPDFKGFHRQYDLSYFFINGMLNLRPANDRIVPYVNAGIGTGDFNISRTTSDSSGATEIGGGCRFFGDDGRAALRVDLSAIRADNFDVSATHASLTLGVTCRLGAAPRHTAPPQPPAPAPGAAQAP